MIRAYCFEYQTEWDQGIHMLLFAVREAVQESLGFSPFELVFGRTVRGPLKLLKENWLASEPTTNLLDQVSDLRLRLTSACELARKNMKATKSRGTIKRYISAFSRWERKCWHFFHYPTNHCKLDFVDHIW